MDTEASLVGFTRSKEAAARPIGVFGLASDLLFSFHDQPTGRLGQTHDKHKNDEGEQDLECDREAPRDS